MFKVEVHGENCPIGFVTLIVKNANNEQDAENMAFTELSELYPKLNKGSLRIYAYPLDFGDSDVAFLN